MWWNDIKDVLEKVAKIEEILDSCIMKEDIQDEIDSFNDRLSSIREDIENITQVSLATKTMDKFDDYMKNVEKLNTMINELKGCVSLARSAVAERKKVDAEFEEMEKVTRISQEIHKSMLSFIKAAESIKHEAHFKIDAIYRAVCEKEEKKAPRKRKPVKKKAVPASLSQ